jgi:signal transduction histidine kinase
VAVILAAFFAQGQVLDADKTAVMKLLAACIGGLHRVQSPARARGSIAGVDERELFMAVTSHELRTPVTVIKGYAETLRDHWDRLTEHQRIESARVIGQRAAELARMVDRLLDASTASEAMTSYTGPFDLLETLRKAAADLPTYLRKRLQLKLPQQLPAALGHRGGLASVVVELVTNAHKYSPGSAPIVLSADSDRRTVFFRVADRGIGISADRAPSTFERFWQGEAGDDRRYGGAGLGLFLVRKTIERQNGWVSLRPRDGGGTVAEVRLPRGDIGVGEA